MQSPLFRFSVFYALGGLALIGLSGYLEGMATASSVAIVWALVGVPLVLIVLGRMNREVSDSASLMYLVGLAILVLLLAVGIFEIWPWTGQLQEFISDFF